MPADPMTKVDWAKENAALQHLLKTGSLKLDSEVTEITRKKGGRSKAASQKCLDDREDE